MTKQEILIADREFLFPALFHYFREPMVVTHAKDQWVWDADGNQYLDFFGGILTVSVGHCNDYVNRRMHEQMDKVQHVSTVYVTEPAVQLAKRIASITPDGGGLTKSMFTNSGTEANETAIMAARCYTGSSEIVALRHSYHGRSNLAAALTGNHAWRTASMPQAGVVFAHNAYCYRCPFGLEYPSCDVRCAHDVKELVETTTSAHIAGLIAEPIQGVGGFVTPPKEYFGIMADIIRKHGGIVISDEVQTAWGRTGGKWFGIEQYGVVPDMITSAKGLANGSPIGLTVTRPEIAAKFPTPTISTFGGNPVTTTAALAVLDFVEENRLRDNAETMGRHLREGLEALADKHPMIGEVRGMGLMQAVELVRDRRTREAAPQETAAVLEATRAQRILVGKGGLYGNVLRVTPPLNIGKSDVDEFLQRLDRAFESVPLD